MNTITVVGLVAGLFSTFGFVPQAIKTWQTQSSHDLSPSTFGVLVTGALLWLIYGTMTWDVPLIIANSISLALQIGILALVVWHRYDHLSLADVLYRFQFMSEPVPDNPHRTPPEAADREAPAAAGRRGGLGG